MDTVFLGFDSGVLQTSGLKAAHESANLFDLNDCFDIFATVGDCEYSRALLLSKVCPLYKIKHGIVYYLDQRIKTKDWFDRILLLGET